MLRRRRSIALAAVWFGALLCAGCPGADLDGHRCTTSDQCGPDGRCENVGVCSFPASACASGWGYAAEAAGELAGTCVPTCDLAGGDAACASGVCIDGACASESEVRYVATSGSDGAVCSAAEPCRTVARALAARSGRAIVALAPGSYPGSVEINPTDQVDPPFAVWLVGQVGANGERPTILATDTAVNRDAIELTRGAATIRHLELHGAAQQGSDGVRANPSTSATIDDSVIVGGRGLDADAVDCTSCDLDIRRSELRGSQSLGIYVETGRQIVLIGNTIAGNSDGGFDVTAATCTIGSNAIVDNGSATSAVGGARLSCTTHQFEHNTLARNTAMDPTRAQYRCESGAAANVSNLFDGPAAGVTGCDHAYSLVTSGTLAGMNNQTAAASFVSATDVHLRPDSPARGAASPTTTIAIDLDGEPRIQGAPDIGADEIP